MMDMIVVNRLLDWFRLDTRLLGSLWKWMRMMRCGFMIMPRGGGRESCSLWAFLVRIGVKGKTSLGCIYRVVESLK